MLILSQWISLNNRCLGCETTCKQTCLQLCCQNAVWKEKSKLHGKKPGRASWSWLPKRQSTIGKKQKDAVQGDTLPWKSNFISQSVNSSAVTTQIWNIQNSKYKESCYLRSGQTSIWTASSPQEEKKPTHNQAPSRRNPGRGYRL